MVENDVLGSIVDGIRHVVGIDESRLALDTPLYLGVVKGRNGLQSLIIDGPLVIPADIQVVLGYGCAVPGVGHLFVDMPARSLLHGRVVAGFRQSLDIQGGAGAIPSVRVLLEQGVILRRQKREFFLHGYGGSPFIRLFHYTMRKICGTFSVLPWSSSSTGASPRFSSSLQNKK